MKISPHSGNCCAIKTISGLGLGPDVFIWTAKEVDDKSILQADRYGDDFDTGQNFYVDGRPKERASTRFKVYIEYLERVRKYGIVEVVIVVPSYGGLKIKDHLSERLEDGEIQSFDAYRGSGESYGFHEDVDCSYDQSAWIPFLEEMGFKEVTRCPNSNSGQTVAIYHLAMDGEYYKNKEK